MAEFTSPEENHSRKRTIRFHCYPQPSPASTPIASAARLTTPNSHTRFNYNRQPSPTHPPTASAARLTTPSSHTRFNFPPETSPANTPNSIFRAVSKARPVVIDSDSEGGLSPFDVRVGGTSCVEGSEGHTFSGWGFSPSAGPSRPGRATAKRQLDLGGPSQDREGAAQRSDRHETASAPHLSSIAMEAKAIAEKLLRNRETADEGKKLDTLLPLFEDGRYGFHDLQPFLSLSLRDVHPCLYSQPSEGEDDETPELHVQTRKRQTQNTTEKEKNDKLRCPIERENDYKAIKSISTNTCKCDSHQTVTLDAMMELRYERASMTATGKRDQLNDVVRELVSKDNDGKLLLKGKRSLHGVPLCAKVWKAILKVNNYSV